MDVTALEHCLERHRHLVIDIGRLNPEVGYEEKMGGYGDVRVCMLDSGTREPKLVAAKTIRLRAQHKEPQRLAFRLARELRVWARLQHPHVLPLLGYYLDENLKIAVLISDYQTHGDLRDYIEQENPSWAMRLQLIRDTTDGLAYLHGENPPIRHGDLKTGNILINAKRQAMLADFGLSKSLEDGPTGLSTSDGLKGTLRYYSPELMDDQEGTGRYLTSDIWAWACLALEVLTDRIPYAGKNTEHAIIVAIVMGEPPSETDCLPIPILDLRLLLAKCWSREPDERPSAGYCLRILNSALSASQTDDRTGTTVVQCVSLRQDFRFTDASTRTNSTGTQPPFQINAIDVSFTYPKAEVEQDTNSAYNECYAQATSAAPSKGGIPHVIRGICSKAEEHSLVGETDWTIGRNATEMIMNDYDIPLPSPCASASFISDSTPKNGPHSATSAHVSTIKPIQLQEVSEAYPEMPVTGQAERTSEGEQSAPPVRFAGSFTNDKDSEEVDIGPDTELLSPSSRYAPASPSIPSTRAESTGGQSGVRKAGLNTFLSDGTNHDGSHDNDSDAVPQRCNAPQRSAQLVPEPVNQTWVPRSIEFRRRESFDKLIIKATADAESYAIVEITRVADGASIRGSMFSKLLIPYDEWKHYQIYRTILGGAALGRPLTDNQLMIYCWAWADARGTLTFYVQRYEGAQREYRFILQRALGEENSKSKSKQQVHGRDEHTMLGHRPIWSESDPSSARHGLDPVNEPPPSLLNNMRQQADGWWIASHGLFAAAAAESATTSSPLAESPGPTPPSAATPSTSQPSQYATNTLYTSTSSTLQRAHSTPFVTQNNPNPHPYSGTEHGGHRQLRPGALDSSAREIEWKMLPATTPSQLNPPPVAASFNPPPTGYNASQQLTQLSSAMFQPSVKATAGSRRTLHSPMSMSNLNGPRIINPAVTLPKSQGVKQAPTRSIESDALLQALYVATAYTILLAPLVHPSIPHRHQNPQSLTQICSTMAHRVGVLEPAAGREMYGNPLSRSHSDRASLFSPGVLADSPMKRNPASRSQSSTGLADALTQARAVRASLQNP